MLKSAVIYSRKDKNERTKFGLASKNIISFPHQDSQKFLESTPQVIPKASIIEPKPVRQIRRKDIQKPKEKIRYKPFTTRNDIRLLQTKSVFPFSFFPSTLIIDTAKVSIIKTQLFATEYIVTIPLEDIAEITVQSTHILSKLTISYIPLATNSIGMEPVKVQIDNLNKQVAIKAKHILRSVIAAKNSNVDLSSLSPKEIVEVIKKFGKSIPLI